MVIKIAALSNVGTVICSLNKHLLSEFDLYGIDLLTFTEESFEKLLALGDNEQEIHGLSGNY